MQSLKDTASWAAGQHGPARAVARATQQHVSTVYRARESGGIELEALEHVRQLARGQGTSPAVWIELLRAEARAGAMIDKPADWLIRRWHQIRDEQLPQNEMLAMLARRGTDRHEERQCDIILSSLHTELTALDIELEKRTLNPRDFDANGRKRVRI